MLGILGLLSLYVAGCAGGPRSPGSAQSPGGPFKVTVIGDWNDVEASLYAVIGNAEAAILSSTQTADSQVFELLTIMDEPGFVYAKRVPGDGNDLIPITVWCTLGFYGDAAAERSLTQDLAA